MKILIVSDTHRRDENLRYVLEREAPFDMLISGMPREASMRSKSGWSRAAALRW